MSGFGGTCETSRMSRPAPIATPISTAGNGADPPAGAATSSPRRAGDGRLRLARAAGGERRGGEKRREGRRMVSPENWHPQETTTGGRLHPPFGGRLQASGRLKEASRPTRSAWRWVRVFSKRRRRWVRTVRDRDPEGDGGLGVGAAGADELEDARLGGGQVEERGDGDERAPGGG